MYALLDSARQFKFDLLISKQIAAPFVSFVFFCFFLFCFVFFVCRCIRLWLRSHNDIRDLLTLSQRFNEFLRAAIVNWGPEVRLANTNSYDWESSRAVRPSGDCACLTCRRCSPDVYVYVYMVAVVSIRTQLTHARAAFVFNCDRLRSAGALSNFWSTSEDTRIR